jgi:hypothetical protein
MEYVILYVLLSGAVVQTPATPLECAEHAIRLTEGLHPSDDDGVPIVYAWCGQRRLLETAIALRQKQMAGTQ